MRTPPRGRSYRLGPRLRTAAALLPLLPLFLAACGGGAGAKAPNYGTVSIQNETDGSQAPQTVVAFYMQPMGVTDAGLDLLRAPIPPGGVVIVGHFPPGLYDAEVVLSIAANLVFRELEVRAGEPTNIVVPAP